MNIQFKLVNKPDRFGRCPVNLKTYFAGQTIVFYTGERCLPEQFDAQKQCFRRNYDAYQVANQRLKQIESALLNIIRNAQLNNQSLSVEDIRQHLTDETRTYKKPQKSQGSFTDFYQQFVAHKTAKGLKSETLRAYKNHFGKLDSFRNLNKLALSDYNQAFHQSFHAWLINQNYHPNYVGNIFKTLRTFFNFIRRDYPDKLPINIAKVPKIYITPERQSLTLDELNALEQIATTTELTASQQLALDKFLFECYTGLRHSDHRQLSRANIKSEGGFFYISRILKKTSSTSSKQVERLEIPILPKALLLLQKYEGKTKSLFPPMHEANVNKYIKQIAKLAGLNYPVEVIRYVKGSPVHVTLPKYQTITLHQARHTFATLAILLGAATEDVQRALGHKDINTTRIYDHVADNIRIKRAFEALKKL